MSHPKPVPLYCPTIALGGYSSHSGKFHYIQDTRSIYAALPLVNPGKQHSRPRHSFHPLYFWLILLLSEPSHLQVTSSAHPQQPSSIMPAHQRGGPTLWFLSFMREAVECDGS